MTATQHSVEKTLAEFTEVHGAVLLGMHRELQSIQKKVDEKISTETAAIKDYGENIHEKLQSINDKTFNISESLTFSIELLKKKQFEIITHVDKQIRDSKNDTLEIVNNARSEAESALAETKIAFGDFYKDFKNKIQQETSRVLQSVESRVNNLGDYFNAENEKLSLRASALEAQQHSVKESTDKLINETKIHQAQVIRLNKIMWASAVSAIAIFASLVVYRVYSQ